MKHSIFYINLRNCNPIVYLHAHNMQISFAIVMRKSLNVLFFNILNLCDDSVHHV